MYKFIATILLLPAVNSFTIQPTLNNRLSRPALTPSLNNVKSSQNVFTGHTTTSLSLKVKVDPDAKGNNNAAGNAKMAAYGGSVLVALALPFVFLLWSAIGH